jgi:hypothetical protein
VSNCLGAAAELGMNKELVVVVVADGGDANHLQAMNAVSGLRY